MELAADTPPVQNVAQVPVQVPWLSPRLETSATAISEMGGHQPQQRRHGLLQAQGTAAVCTEPVCTEPWWIFSRAGISSSEASRVNMVSPCGQRGVRGGQTVL